MTYEQLKAAHQAIIDAWHAAWIERARWRAEEVFLRRSTENHKGKRRLKMSEFKQYRRKQIAELRHWNPEINMSQVSVSAEDEKAGSPKFGDMIARNPKNHADQWLVAAAYFKDNFEPV